MKPSMRGVDRGTSAQDRGKPVASDSTAERDVVTAQPTGKRSLGGDAFVVVVECLVLMPVLLLSASIPFVPLGLGIGLTLLTAWWPVDAGNVPRIVTGLMALLAFLAAVVGLLA
jgi:hypothetical protein